MYLADKVIQSGHGSRNRYNPSYESQDQHNLAREILKPGPTGHGFYEAWRGIRETSTTWRGICEISRTSHRTMSTLRPCIQCMSPYLLLVVLWEDVLLVWHSSGNICVFLMHRNGSVSDQSTTEDTVSQQMKEQQNIYYSGSEVTISATREYQHALPEFPGASLERTSLHSEQVSHRCC